jgi:hypothetical protein
MMIELMGEVQGTMAEPPKICFAKWIVVVNNPVCAHRTTTSLCGKEWRATFDRSVVTCSDCRKIILGADDATDAG